MSNLRCSRWRRTRNQGPEPAREITGLEPARGLGGLRRKFDSPSVIVGINLQFAYACPVFGNTFRSRAQALGRLTVRFAVASLALLTLTRLALCLWLSDRVQAVGGMVPVMLGGLRIDLSLIAMVILAPAAIAPWMGHRRFPTRLAAIAFRTLWIVIVLLEISSPQFILEYDTRPNRLFVEYLLSPREVGAMLWEGYKGLLAATVVLLSVAGLLSIRLFPADRPDVRMPGWKRPLVSIAVAAALVLVGRGTLDHRPINPSVVAFGNDAMVNSLPLNSAYSVAHAVYRSRSERSSEAAYGRMAESDMHELVRAAAGIAHPIDGSALPTLHRQVASVPRAEPLNLVVVIEESLGAQFVAGLGGRHLAPNLDRWSGRGWNFRRAYATGTRSARGLEAIITGFLPTPSEAVLKLPRAQSGFFTLAGLLGQHGYRSRFVYGGEAHFDNMRAFFLGNGFDEVVDSTRFEAPEFVGTWGASDDDLFRQLDRLLRAPDGRPTLTVAFTVSNHTPWEFPEGRVPVVGKPGADDAVRYADQALGNFLDRASAAPYWKNTVFLVVADHDARAGGAGLIPVHNFHIPAFIVGADVAPRQDDRLVSQIDMAPTLLSLIGLDTIHPMLGADLTVRDPNRALLQYGDNFGYLSGDRLIVLEPGKTARQFHHAAAPGPAPAALQPVELDPSLGMIALAHALWPEWAYRNRRYRIDTASQATPVTDPDGLRPQDLFMGYTALSQSGGGRCGQGYAAANRSCPHPQAAH